MSDTKGLNLSALFIVILLTRPGFLYGQLNPSNPSLYSASVLDTSEYIPSFYPGALDYNLMIAASNGYSTEIVRLISKGADIDAVTDENVTPLIYAVINNRLAAVSALLSYSPDIDKVTSNYETPLIISVKNRNFEITEALIRAGASIDKPDRYGASPLHLASVYAYTDIVDLLLFYGASIDMKTEEGTTPLLAAVWAGNYEIADLLVQNGANMEARDNEGFTPFLMASLYGDTLIMNYLFEKGVDIYAVNIFRYNSLCLTIMANYPAATQLLFRLGDRWADPDRKTLNPYDVAAKYRRKEAITILQENSFPGRVKKEIDQLSFSLSSRMSLHEKYAGISASFKEPYMNAGLIFGLDTKLRYSRILIKNGENILYQYQYKSNLAYAGIFKDYLLTDKPNKYNLAFSTALLAGYSFGTILKGTSVEPDNRFLIIPSLGFKIAKMNFAMEFDIEYINSDFYKSGPLWLRAGFLTTITLMR